MVLRLHAPLAHFRGGPASILPPPLPLLPAAAAPPRSVFPLPFFPTCPGFPSSFSLFSFFFFLFFFSFFLPFISISRGRRVSFSLAISGNALLPSFSCRSSFLPRARARTSLFLSVRHRPPADLADYVTGCNVKYETLHPAVSLESKGSPRETRSRVSGRDTAKREKHERLHGVVSL